MSSFNNAGFALFGDSLMSFSDDPVVLLTTSGATVLGGMPRHLRILNGFAMSAYTRTAGFNSIDTAAMDPATWLGMDLLMLIGGGPAGTAGGIKVTTFAVLFFLMLGELRGAGAVTVFGKRLSRAVHRQAITVIVMAVGLVTASTIAIMLMTDLSLDEILFEVVSAFATVGLSTGITAELPVEAQLIIVALMFIGRLGPITVATGLALRHRTLLYDLPKERPIIG